MDNMELILQELRGINGHLGGIDTRLDRIDARLDRIETDVEELREAHEITRDGVNKLVGWADGVGDAFNIPFAQAK